MEHLAVVSAERSRAGKLQKKPKEKTKRVGEELFAHAQANLPLDGDPPSLLDAI
jgi:hypothetical protein